MVIHALTEGRKAWLQLTRGSIKLDDQQLRASDGATIDGLITITVTGVSNAEILLFDMG